MGQETNSPEEFWRSLVEDGFIPFENRMRKVFKFLPKNPRCRLCYAPFDGLGGAAMRVFHKYPSIVSPQICNACEDHARKYPGGAEVDIALLFADVRGSTGLAEKMGIREYSRLIDRFFNVATGTLVRADAVIEKLIGDEVTGLFFPGFTGKDYVRRAIEAALDLLEATGHHGQQDPWIPVGVGVNCGLTFVGNVGSKDSVSYFTSLGDAPNVTARLASLAGTGEVLVSQAAMLASGWDTTGLEQRCLELKGRSEQVEAWVIRA